MLMRSVMLVIIGLLALLMAPAVEAAGNTINQSGPCTTSWTAPTTNTNGTPLIDLKEYRVYVVRTATLAEAQTALASTVLVPTAVVPAAAANPPANLKVTWDCGGKFPVAGQHWATVAAADLTALESTRVAPVPFLLQDDVRPSPVTGLAVDGL